MFLEPSKDSNLKHSLTLSRTQFCVKIQVISQTTMYLYIKQVLSKKKQTLQVNPIHQLFKIASPYIEMQSLLR